MDNNIVKTVYSGLKESTEKISGSVAELNRLEEK